MEKLEKKYQTKENSKGTIEIGKQIRNRPRQPRRRSLYVSMRQHTSAYASIHGHRETSAAQAEEPVPVQTRRPLHLSRTGRPPLYWSALHDSTDARHGSCVYVCVGGWGGCKGTHTHTHTHTHTTHAYTHTHNHTHTYTYTYTYTHTHTHTRKYVVI
jgi:hypothetical protein